MRYLFFMLATWGVGGMKKKMDALRVHSFLFWLKMFLYRLFCVCVFFSCFFFIVQTNLYKNITIPHTKNGHKMVNVFFFCFFLNFK